MKKKKPPQNEFAFSSGLPPEDFNVQVSHRVKEYSAQKREILYRETSQADGKKGFWLGLEKGDHAGFWYCPSVEPTADGCTIRGKIVYDPDGYTGRGGDKRGFWEALSDGVAVAIVFVLFIIPILLWQIGIFIAGRFQKNKPKTKEALLEDFMCNYMGCRKEA